MFEKIRSYLASELDISEDEITRDTTFESLGVDSLDTVEMVMDGDNPGKSGTDHVLQQQDAADRNMCGSSGNRSERGKCLIICRRLRMIKRIVSSDNCSMHCQANKNAGIMRDLCALQAGDYEDRRDYVYRRNHI